MFEVVKKILLEVKEDLDESKLCLDADLKTDLGFNSLELMELVGEVEDVYDIEIPERKIRDIVTINDVVNLLNELGINNE